MILVLDAWVEHNADTWAPSSARDQPSRVNAIETDERFVRLPNPACRRTRGPRTMTLVGSHAYDLWYDANSVGADLVVETWISHGPRAADGSFDPQPGDWVRLGDDDEAPHHARVIRRDGDRVCGQIAHPPFAATAASATAEQ